MVKEHNSDPRASHQAVGQLGAQQVIHQGGRSGNQIGGANTQSVPQAAQPNRHRNRNEDREEIKEGDRERREEEERRKRDHKRHDKDRKEDRYRKLVWPWKSRGVDRPAGLRRNLMCGRQL